MIINESATLIPQNNNIKEVETSINTFNQPLANLLIHHDLPVDNILMPIDERRKVIFSLGSVLEILPYEKKQKSYYLSKFTVAIAVGLFDGALNFIWDETVKALRQLTISFDLQYFYTVAETLSGRYKNLCREEELELISEFDLLEICRRIGFLSDLTHKKLEHINYLRNHVSAAHPNENTISGFEMISLLENCIKYAINSEIDHSVIQIKVLFENIRKIEIPETDFQIIGSDLAKQPKERLEDFILSLFGLYCDPRQETKVHNNIEKIVPYLWELISEETKYRIGTKFGLFRKNGQVDKKDLCQRFLEIVGGLHYKDEDSLSAELIEKLQDLRSIHFRNNNFYNEYTYAESIDTSLPTSGIPKAIKKNFVKIICICFAGNGKGYRTGVDERALPYYKKFIESFTTEEVNEFLLLFEDSEFVTDLNEYLPDQRIRKIAKYLKGKTTNPHINKALDKVISFPEKKLNKIWGDSDYQNSLRNIK